MKRIGLLIALAFVINFSLAQQENVETKEESAPIEETEVTSPEDLNEPTLNSIPEESDPQVSYEDELQRELQHTRQQLDDSRRIIEGLEWELDESRYQKYRKHGQMKTLSGNIRHHGGFGAIGLKITQFKNEDIVLAGVRGGWTINRVLSMGFEGYGIIPSTEFRNVAPTNDARLLGGYGGFFMEPVFWSNQVVHFTVPISTGAGWVGFHDDWEDTSDGSSELIDGDVIWYIEPGVTMEVNVARHFRIDLGLSHRFTQDLDLITANSKDFNGLNYFVTMKFGSF